MKRLPIGVCIAIALVLVLFGLVFGTVRGFSEDRAQVQTLFGGNGGLQDILFYRGADGLNLCVVASRHLSADDADLLALRQTASVLTDEGSSVQNQREADEVLDALFDRVREKTEETDSILSSDRDEQYLLLLQSDLQSWAAARKEAVNSYNQAAEKFNAQLSSPISGVIASIFGVAPCTLYQ